MLDDTAERDMLWVQQFILGIRKVKAEMNIKPSASVSVLLSGSSQEDRRLVSANRVYLDFLARTRSIDILEPGDEEPESATTLVGAMKVLIPLAGLIDRDAEISRLTREIEKLSADLDKTTTKLANRHFVGRAPTAVVAKERDRLSRIEQDLSSLAGQLEKIQAMGAQPGQPTANREPSSV